MTGFRLVVAPLTLAAILAWLVLSMLVTSAVKPGSEAQAAPYLYVSQCREALQGHDGTDNDVLREIRALNASGSDVVRWSWGIASRNGPGHVFQPFFMRRANGQLVARYYHCYFSSTGRVADAAFTPFPS